MTESSLPTMNAGRDTHRPQNACERTAGPQCFAGAAARSANAGTRCQAIAQRRQLLAQTNENHARRHGTKGGPRAQSVNTNMAGLETGDGQNVHQGMGDGHTEPVSTRELWKRTHVS